MFIQGKQSPMQFHFLFIFSGGGFLEGGMNTHVYGVSGSGSTGNCRTLFIQSPVSIQRVPMQTSPDCHAKNVSSALEEQPSQAGGGAQSQLSLRLNYVESPSTKPCCLKHSSLKICFLSDFPYILPHIF